jgi:hypothetical protein
VLMKSFSISTVITTWNSGSKYLLYPKHIRFLSLDCKRCPVVHIYNIYIYTYIYEYVYIYTQIYRHTHMYICICINHPFVDSIYPSLVSKIKNINNLIQNDWSVSCLIIQSALILPEGSIWSYDMVLKIHGHHGRGGMNS